MIYHIFPNSVFYEMFANIYVPKGISESITLFVSARVSELH